MLLNVIILINAFILSFSASLVLCIDKMVIKLLVCFVVVFVLIYALFEIAGKYFKNKEEKKENV